jgi:hypothetical protein
MFIAASPSQFSIILVRRTPFRPEDSRVLRTLSEINGMRVLYSPDGIGPPSVYRDYFAAPDRAAFVRDYPFRIEATTDDEPFFFEHARFTNLLQSRDIILGAASGQMVLVVTLGIVVASGVVFLWLPVQWARKRTAAVLGSVGARWEAYFLALGFGFIGMEVALVPRFVLYLGHPVYALTIVLFALLVAAGIGSALSPRIVAGDARRLAAVAVCAGALIAVEALTLRYVFHRTFAVSMTARAVISIVLVGTPALPMGMLFPGGLEQAPTGDHRAPWIARAWVLNGWASVVGSVGTMTLSIAVGFTRVLLVAAAFYILAAFVSFGGVRVGTDAG